MNNVICIISVQIKLNYQLSIINYQLTYIKCRLGVGLVQGQRIFKILVMLYVCASYTWQRCRGVGFSRKSFSEVNSKAFFALPYLPFCLRYASLISPFQVRFKSVPKNGRKMGITQESHRTCKQPKLHKHRRPNLQELIIRITPLSHYQKAIFYLYFTKYIAGTLTDIIA